MKDKSTDTPAQETLAERPDWVSDEMFPFESRFFVTPTGQSLHYIDEGAGDPIVFVHGNPTWSFEFRHLVSGLRGGHRCIAVDHVGFGLSSRSAERDDYHPRSHSKNLIALLESLDLQNVTLFMSDWGGPIGLEFARRYPDRVKRLVIANSWAWPVSGDMHFIQFSFMMSSWLGQFFIRHFNIFVNMVLPKAVGVKRVMTPEVMHHYRSAQASAFERNANAALPGYITGASDWLGEIWGDKDAFADTPTLLLWGFKDIAFRRKEFDAWQEALSTVEAHEFPDCGHLIAEEAPDETLELMKRFFDKHPVT